MKSCPTCGTRYTDDTLSFCLSDGSRLDGDDAASAVTVEISETDTFVRPGSNAPLPAKPVSRTGIAVAVTAAVMLLLFGIVGVIGFLIWRSYESNTGNATPNRAENRVIVNATSPSPVATAKPTQPAASPKPTIASSPTPTTPNRANYPATARIRLAKGRFSAPFSGEINPGDERSFVLTCRAGQSLSASISGGSCVTFSGGGTSMSRTTVAGDNYLTVTNNCSSVARFSGSVSIF